MASKAAELRELNDTELEHRLGEAKEELFNLRFQNATGQLDNIARIPQVRRDVARIETLLREREIAAAEQHGSAGVGTMADDRRTEATRTTHRKVREGIVVSTKMDKTVVVAVVDRVRHRRYGKTLQRTSHLYAHDEANDAREGDRVRIAETRPLSKLKRWRVVEVAGACRGDPAGELGSRWPTTRARARCSASRCSAAPAGATRASATSSSPR